MPKYRFERSEPTHDWQELRTLLTDPTQLTYEIIRPVILGWTTPRERASAVFPRPCVKPLWTEEA
jgi:hypothetical protein